MNKALHYTYIARYLFLPFLLFSIMPLANAVQAGHPQQDIPQTVKRDFNFPSKTCFVWFEVNNSQLLKDYLIYADEWQSLGHAIVTSRKQNVLQIAETLMLNDLSSISGFKTYEFFLNSSIYDPKAWEDIAKMARSLSRITEGKPVVLENEGAVKHLLEQNIKSIDYKRLYSVIAQQKWPTIWFWYAPIGTTKKVQSMSLNIARAVTDGIPNSHLIEASSAGYAKHRQKASSLNLERTLVLDSNPLSIVYLDNKRNRFWRYRKISEAIKQAEGDRVILYPGFDDLQMAKYTNKTIRKGLCKNS